MRGLMLKILLWFWLTLALMATVLTIIWMTSENGPLINRIRVVLRPAITMQAQTATEIYERSGREALAAHFDQIEKTTGMRSFLLDARQQELSGRASDKTFRDLQPLIARAVRNNRPDYRLMLRDTLTTLPICSPSGQCYCFAAWFPGDELTSTWSPGLFLLRFVLMLLIGAGVCYWLAQYLTKPIVQLRHVTQRIAAGDLAARVSSQLENRNDEIAGLAQDFNVMAGRIADLLASQRRLLGDISHELRSPLTRLNIALELARQTTHNSAPEEHDRIERESQRLNEMIEQLLTLTRVESDAALDFSEIDLAQLIQEITADADFEARNRQRSVRADIRGNGMAYGAPQLLRSAIENVVRNAVRYTAAETEVVVTLDKLKASHREIMRLTVDDHGPGVPEESLAHLFRPFYRVEAARDRQSGGTGLGLAITERAIHSFGGTIAARIRPQGGLRIEITLPLSSPTV